MTHRPCTILHVDMDALFVAVEEFDNTSLWGRSVIVGGAIALIAHRPPADPLSGAAGGVRASEYRLSGLLSEDPAGFSPPGQ